MKTKRTTIFKNILLYVLGFTFAVSMNSCKKDKDDSPSPTPTEDTAVYFRFKINNVSFVDDSRFADYTGTGQTRVISMNDDEILRIDFNSEATGTFNLNNTNNNLITFVDVNGVVYKSISGSLEVTKYDKTAQKISGTFTGTIKEENGTAQKAITEGKFNNIRVTPF